MVLINGEVTVLALSLKRLLFLGSSLFPLLHLGPELVFLLTLLGVVSPVLLTLVFLLDDSVDHVLDAALRLVLLDLGPLHHNGVLELDSQHVFPLRFLVCLHRVGHVVVEDVVQGQVQGEVLKFVLHFFPGLADVLPLLLDGGHFRVVQHEARDVGATHEISVSVIIDHERSVVNDCTSSKPLNDKVFIIDSTIVLAGDFDDSLLDQEQFVRQLSRLTDEGAFLVGESFESVNDLLLGVQAKSLEIVDFVHFNGDPSREFVVVLENLFLEQAGQRFKCLCKLLKVRLSEESQCSVVLRADRRCSFAIKEHSNLAEVITVNEVCDWLLLGVLVGDGRPQVLSPHMDRELTVTDEIHEAFDVLIDESTVFVALGLGIVRRNVLLLKINHVWAREDALEFDHQLGDALLFLLRRDFLDTGWGDILLNLLLLDSHIGFLDFDQHAVLLNQVLEVVFGDLALVDGRNLVHEVG